jgi:hypothetical protein
MAPSGGCGPVKGNVYARGPTSRRKASRDPICLSPYLYRARNRDERFFNKIEHCRRLAPRHDRLAANYLAFVQLAPIRLWLHLDESASWLGCVPINLAASCDG